MATKNVLIVFIICVFVVNVASAKICATNDTNVVTYRICEANSHGECKENDMCSDRLPYDLGKYSAAAKSNKVFYAQYLSDGNNQKWIPDKNTFEAVYLIQNNIRTVNQHTFKNLVNVKELELKGNEVDHVEKCSFCGLTNLRRLFLTNNRMSEVPHFGNVTVQVINLSNNRITVLINNTFRQCSHLTNLGLYHNDVEVVEPCAFCGAKQLEDLDLGGNRIASLPDDLFRELVHLRSLNMQKNVLTEIRSDLFATNSDLENIDLSNNRIVMIEANSFAGIHHIKHLNMEGNNLHFIHDNMFKGAVAIDYLNIAENDLILLTNETITQLNAVVHNEIDLGRNRFMCSYRDIIMETLLNAVDDGDKHIHCNAESKRRIRRTTSSYPTPAPTPTPTPRNFIACNTSPRTKRN